MATGERMKGKLEKLSGSIKQRIGRARGDAQAAKEADAERGRGALRDEQARGSAKLDAIGSQVKGRAQSVVGAATGDTRKQIKGKIEEWKGRAKGRLGR